MNTSRVVLYLNMLAMCLLSSLAQGQTEKKVLNEIRAFQKELDRLYHNRKKSPLEEADRKQFGGHQYFPIDLKYRVKASFTRTPGHQPFQIGTTRPRKALYVKYGEVTFEVDGQTCSLILYQGLQEQDAADYDGHLLLAFTDLTSGEESYGGGRYVDVSIPTDNTLIIDFNQAYNPYCAYNHNYSCVIPPKENSLPVAIRAGVMDPGLH